jgi:hypothetical protein
MKRILLSCVVVLSAISIMAQNNVTLKMNLEKNKVYRLSSTAEVTTIQTVNGNQQTVESETHYSATFKMVDATPEFMVTEVRIDTMITKTNTMGKSVLMSSVNEGNIASSETADVMSYVMNRLSKNPLYVKIDYKGGVTEILNGKMLSEMIAADTVKVTLTGPVGSAIKAQIVNMAGDNNLKTIVESFAGYVPATTVAVGDKWSFSRKTNSGGMALDIETEYHLDGINNGMAAITAESSIKAALNAPPIVSGGARITYDDIKGINKSTILLDVNTGLVADEKAKTHISGTLAVSVQGMSLQIPMDINSEARTKTIK